MVGLGVSKSLQLPGLSGVSGFGLLPDINAEAGTEALAGDLADE